MCSADAIAIAIGIGTSSAAEKAIPDTGVAQAFAGWSRRVGRYLLKRVIVRALSIDLVDVLIVFAFTNNFLLRDIPKV